MLSIWSICCLIQIITSAIWINMQNRGRNANARTYMARDNLPSSANRSRYMNSPQHHYISQINKTISNQYNMQRQRSYLNRQEVHRIKKIEEFIDNYGQASPQQTFIADKSVLLAKLVNQNEFLMKELIVQKKKQSQYERIIRKLKRSKSEQQISFQQIVPKYFQIQKPKRAERSRLTAAQSKLTSSVENDQISFQCEPNRCKQLLDDSLDYINHSKQSLSHEIDLLNDKLCRLVEQSSVQRDKDRREVLQGQISNCVKEIQQLKRYLMKTYS